MKISFRFRNLLEDAVVLAAGGLCSPSVLPAGTDTFAQLYASDGNHPSDPGTYLQGLIIASSITGQTNYINTSFCHVCVHVTIGPEHAPALSWTVMYIISCQDQAIR